jgi:hypothetical protein
MAAAAAQPAMAGEVERWRPRIVRRLGVWRVGEVRAKAYAILTDPDEEIAAPFLAEVRRLLAAEAGTVAAAAHCGAGFAILHREQALLWLQLHWWLPGGTLAGLSWEGSPGTRLTPRPPERPATSCVWELALVDHERRAWIRTGMAPVTAIPAYFDDIYRQDFC